MLVDWLVSYLPQWVNAMLDLDILFDHLPKCGGNTLGQLIASQYRSEQIYAISGRPQADLEKFIDLTPEKKADYRYIWGHEAHSLLPHLEKSYKLITLLRDPIDRIVSYYHWAKRDPDHYLHDLIVGNGLSLIVFATCGVSAELSNFYTCHYANRALDEVGEDPWGSLKLAQDTLALYDHIGFTENLDSFILHLSELLPACYSYDGAHLNKTLDRPGLDSLTKHERESIAAANDLDIKLYKYALSLRADSKLC